jgi:hypothetical protein
VRRERLLRPVTGQLLACSRFREDADFRCRSSTFPLFDVINELQGSIQTTLPIVSYSHGLFVAKCLLWSMFAGCRKRIAKRADLFAV